MTTDTEREEVAPELTACPICGRPKERGCCVCWGECWRGPDGLKLSPLTPGPWLAAHGFMPANTAPADVQWTRGGVTAEGTTWRTRPWSDDVANRYLPERIAPEGAKVKPYSPGKPTGSLSTGLPAEVGADFAEAYRVARLRLDGLEPWPADPFKAPRLSQIAKRLGDAKLAKLYREFVAAVHAAMAPDAAWRNAA